MRHLFKLLARNAVINPIIACIAIGLVVGSCKPVRKQSSDVLLTNVTDGLDQATKECVQNVAGLTLRRFLDSPVGQFFVNICQTFSAAVKADPPKIDLKLGSVRYDPYGVPNKKEYPTFEEYLQAEGGLLGTDIDQKLLKKKWKRQKSKFMSQDQKFMSDPELWLRLAEMRDAVLGQSSDLAFLGCRETPAFGFSAKDILGIPSDDIPNSISRKNCTKVFVKDWGKSILGEIRKMQLFIAKNPFGDALSAVTDQLHFCMRVVGVSVLSFKERSPIFCEKKSLSSAVILLAKRSERSDELPVSFALPGVTNFDEVLNVPLLEEIKDLYNTRTGKYPLNNLGDLSDSWLRNLKAKANWKAFWLSVEAALIAGSFVFATPAVAVKGVVGTAKSGAAAKAALKGAAVQANLAKLTYGAQIIATGAGAIGHTSFVFEQLSQSTSGTLTPMFAFMYGVTNVAALVGAAYGLTQIVKFGIASLKKVPDLKNYAKNLRTFMARPSDPNVAKSVQLAKAGFRPADIFRIQAWGPKVMKQVNDSLDALASSSFRQLALPAGQADEFKKLAGVSDLVARPNTAHIVLVGKNTKLNFLKHFKNNIVTMIANWIRQLKFYIDNPKEIGKTIGKLMRFLKKNAKVENGVYVVDDAANFMLPMGKGEKQSLELVLSKANYKMVQYKRVDDKKLFNLWGKFLEWFANRVKMMKDFDLFGFVRAVPARANQMKNTVFQNLKNIVRFERGAKNNISHFRMGPPEVIETTAVRIK